MDKKTRKRYIENLEKHIQSSEDAVNYSIQRFDILVISLSSGGLVLSVGFVKDVIKDFHDKDVTQLKLAWILFGLTLVMNLISQITSYFANKIEIRTSRNIIRIQKDKEPKGNQNRLLCVGSILNGTTTFLNLASLVSLITAIIFMVIFIYINV